MQVEAMEPASMGSSSTGRASASYSTDTRRLVYGILIAQFLSLALAVTGVSSTSLTRQGVNAPTTQSFLNYCLLAVVFGCFQLVACRLSGQHAQEETDNSQCHMRHSSQQGSRSCSSMSDSSSGPQESSSSKHSTSAESRMMRLKRLWPAFVAVAFLDVQANTLVTKAYQYTSLTSVTLLDCFTVPSVMLLSWLFLKNRYRLGHFLGAFCCIVGLSVLVLGDTRGSPSLPGSLKHSTVSLEDGDGVTIRQSLSETNNSDSMSSGSRPLLGDALVLLGAVLYSVCNVSQELLLGDVPVTELLACIGLFGAIISGLQAIALEHQVLMSANWSQPSVLAPMLAFAAAMFCFYSLVPQVLIWGGAAVLNISLLTSDVWAALARYMWFGGFEGAGMLFFLVSLTMVAAGIVIYALSGSPRQTWTEGQGESVRGVSNAVGDGVTRLHVGSEYSRLRSSDGEVESAAVLLQHHDRAGPHDCRV